MHQNKHSAVMNTDLGDGAVNPIPDLGAWEGGNEASAERSQTIRSRGENPTKDIGSQDSSEPPRTI
jgi:hypothetical protein